MAGSSDIRYGGTVDADFLCMHDPDEWCNCILQTDVVVDVLGALKPLPMKTDGWDNEDEPRTFTDGWTTGTTRRRY